MEIPVFWPGVMLGRVYSLDLLDQHRAIKPFNCSASVCGAAFLLYAVVYLHPQYYIALTTHAGRQWCLVYTGREKR